MDSIIQPISNLSNLVADTSVTFNPDIFEANVVNLAILVTGVYSFLSGQLEAALLNRKDGVIEALKKAEESLAKANEKLRESEARFEQLQLVLDSIKEDGDKNIKQMKSATYQGGRDDVERITLFTQSQIKGLEAKARKEVIDSAVTKAIEGATLKLDGKIGETTQQQLINSNISNL